MIELEIQTLSERREGLLMDIGRFVLASGFTLQRQRLAQGDHGVLMSMVVRGPARSQRALENALDGYERIISFKILPFEEGAPHFAAASKIPRPPPAPAAAPAPVPAPIDQVAAVAALAGKPAAVTPPAAAASVAAPAPRAPSPPPAPPAPVPQAEPELEFILPSPPAAPPAAAPVPEPPFVERTTSGPDVAAVEKALPGITADYPQIYPRLLKLQQAVGEDAREASLQLAGQRTGAWVAANRPAAGTMPSLPEALERVAVPELGALVEVQHKSGQLHLHHSPLCAQDGQSGCIFYSGYLEGLLGPAVGPDNLSIFAVCCRSCGAGECVLAVSDSGVE